MQIAVSDRCFGIILRRKNNDIYLGFCFCFNVIMRSGLFSPICRVTQFLHSHLYNEDFFALKLSQKKRLFTFKKCMAQCVICHIDYASCRAIRQLFHHSSDFSYKIQGPPMIELCGVCIRLIFTVTFWLAVHFA